VPSLRLYRTVFYVPTLGSVAEKTFPRTVALIGLVGTLGGAAITGYFTLLGNDQKPTPPQPPVTTSAAAAVSSSAASPVSTGTLVASQTPATGSAPPSASQPVGTQATVSGVPRQVASGQQLTLHGTGFPKGGAVRITFATYPGEDYQVSSAQTDSQGSFTVTVSSVLLSTVCGYDGHLNTWDDSGGQGLLTSTPLTVAC
jgi:hypothetical protein